MPDITMCEGDGCPKRDKCWRYTAPPSPTGMQSYFVSAPIKDGHCDHFWPVMPSDVRQVEKR